MGYAASSTAVLPAGREWVRRRVFYGLVGLMLVAGLAGYAVWRGRTVALPGSGVSLLEPTPACTPLADVTPAACAIPDPTAVTQPGLSLPEGSPTTSLTAVPTVVILVPLAEGGATPTAQPTVAVMVPLAGSGGQPSAEMDGVIAGPYLGNVTQTSAHVSWVTPGESTLTVRFWRMGQVVGEARPVSHTTPAGIWHEAVLTGLEPGTRYNYTLAGGPEHAFVTAPDDARPFTFLVFGDSRPGDRVDARPSDMAWQVAGQIAEKDFVFALHTGDITAEGGRCEGELSGWEQYRRAYLNLYGATLARAPFYLTPGNHDLAWGTCGQEIFRDVFALPENAPDADRESYYSFDWGNVHVISLNTYLPLGAGSAQLEWLERDLAQNAQQWTVVQFHEPVYTSGDHEPNLAAREAWVPLFEQYGVDLVFSAHNHTYERTCPIRAGACTTLVEGGVVYVVTAGAGPALHSTTGGWFSVLHLSLYHFLTIDVDGGKLELSAWNWQGQLFDRYTMSK